MDTFKEPTPEEAKLLALQFMGQNLGEIKELDKNIIGKTNTLKGNMLDINNILNSIPSPSRTTAPSNNPPPQTLPADMQQRIYQAPPVPAATPILSIEPLIEVLNKINSNLEKAVNLLDK